MRKTTNDSASYKWGTDSVTTGNLYEFPEPINVSSIPITKDAITKQKICDDSDRVRFFKTGRLIQVNNELGKCFFIGHKIPENGAKKSNRKYIFGLPLPQLVEAEVATLS